MVSDCCLSMFVSSLNFCCFNLCSISSDSFDPSAILFFCPSKELSAFFVDCGFVAKGVAFADDVEGVVADVVVVKHPSRRKRRFRIYSRHTKLLLIKILRVL